MREPDLKRTRTTLRLSQSALARLSGVRRVHICLHELGDRILTPQEQSRIEAAIRREMERLRNADKSIAFEERADVRIKA